MDVTPGPGHVFLSYATQDRDRAQQLAHYLNARGWAVWWDREIPAGQAYDDAIEEALREARCAVVLWSKSSVASQWVRAEASEAARRAILVPALIEDVTVPLGFRLMQAVDLREWNGGSDAEELESVHVAVARVSGGLGTEAVRPASGLRHRLSPVRRVLLAVLLSLVGAGVWYWDAFYREHVEHYAQVTKRWGFPEGVGRLTGDQVAGRSTNLALVRRGRWNHPHEVRLVNSSGSTPPAHAYLPPHSLADLNPLQPTTAELGTSETWTITRVTFERDAAGRILEQAGFSRAGRRLYTIRHAEPDLGEYKRQGFPTAVRASGITHVKFVRGTSGSVAGLEETVLYLDPHRQPQPDEAGRYGRRIVRDAQGLVREVVNLGANGQAAVNAFGVLKERRSYDDRGNLVEAGTRDAHGALKPSSIGAAVVRLQYDRVGNVIQMGFYGPDRQPMLLEAVGAAGRRFTYDRRGNLTMGTFFGPDQRLVMGRPGFAKQTVEWNAPGQSLTRFYGPDDRPLPAFGGAFQGRETWNGLGLSTETTYLDDKGDVTRVDNGCATVRMKYDGVGNLSELHCLNEQGAPTLTVSGFSTVRMTYDDFGNALTTAYADLAGTPGLQGETYAGLQRSFDELNKVVRETYVDAQGRPVRSREGFATETYEYDARGHLVERVYSDEQGRRVAAVGGCAAIRTRVDERGLEVENTCLDVAGKPVRNAEGHAGRRIDYDGRGFAVAVHLYDEARRPTVGRAGYAIVRLKRNASGQRLEEAYFDERGVPIVASRFGAATRRWGYDGAGRVAQRDDYDAAGRLARNADGYATMKYRYDEYGREIGREVYDAAGRKLEARVGVERVTPGSVAEAVGLRAGDLVIAYDGETVSTSEQFAKRLEVFKGDRARELRVERPGGIGTLELPPGRLHGLQLVERVP